MSAVDRNWISVADEACTALASVHAMRDGSWDPATFPLTVQFSANLIRNTDHGTLTAESDGRATVVIQSTVKNDAGRLIATVTQIVPGR